MPPNALPAPDPPVARLRRGRTRRMRAARGLGVAACGIGVLGLAGWVLGIPALRNVLPGLASMKVNTAIGIALCGAALVARSPWGRWRAAGLVCGGLAAVIGLGTLAEFVLDVDLRLDELVLPDRPGDALPYFPGRMAPTTAAALFLTGLSLAVGAVSRGVACRRVIAASSFAVLAIAFLSLTGVLLGVRPEGAVAFHTTQMALHTSSSFLLLSAGALVALPRGPLRLPLVADDAGGAAARRLIPAAIGIPAGAAALAYAGLDRGWYGPEFVVAALISASALPAAVAAGLFAERLSLEDRRRREAAEALRRANVELEARVAARTADLAAANRELEAFCHSISHDLRSPLLTIDGFGHALEAAEGASLTADGREKLARIRAGARRMGAQMDALLELSRLTRAELRRDRVDLSALAEAILAELRLSEPGRRVAVSVQPGLAATGDPRLLRLALQNLLQNAWKFTGRREDARIEFRSEDGPAGREFLVADNGAGFDGLQADKLFRSFRRLHAAEEFPGHGVGLASVARIVERHGGRIRAESSPGRGAIFRFTLGEPT